MCLGGREQHAGRRLAACAGTREVRMVRTLKERVDARPGSSKQLRQVVVDRVHLAGAVEPPGDAGLVRDDDDDKARAVEAPYGFRRTGYQFDIGRAVEIVDLDVDRAVTVEENSRLSGHANTWCPGHRGAPR